MFLIGLKRVTGRGIKTVVNHVLDAQAFCNWIRKADSHAIVINAKLNLTRPVVCIGAHRFKKRRRNAFLVFDCRLSLTTICTTPSFRTIHNRIIRRTFAY